MTITEKTEELKTLVNWDFSNFVRETLVYPYDFKKAVEFALRTICKTVRAMQSSIIIPMSNEQRFYSFDNLSKYTKRKIEIVKVSGLAYNNNSEWKDIENVDFSVIDIYSRLAFEQISQRIHGQFSQFKLALTSKTVAAGIFDTIAALPSNNQITISNSVSINRTITNLDKVEQNEFITSNVTVAGITVTLGNNIKLTPYNWEVGDKIYVSEGKPTFIAIDFQAMPKFGYFDTEIEIPILPALLDSIDSLAINHLYSLLIARDASPTMVNRINGLRLTQKIKLESEVLAECKRIVASLKIAILRSYLPYGGTIYGR